MNPMMCGNAGPGRNVTCQLRTGHTGWHKGLDWETTFARTAPGSIVTPAEVTWSDRGRTITLTDEETAGILYAISFLSDGAHNEYDYEAMRDTANFVERLENHDVS